MNFNTQICTTREQSERLLALGLKKETADMCLDEVIKGKWQPIAVPAIFGSQIPAWSLHRLWALLPLFICDDYRWKVMSSDSVFYINRNWRSDEYSFSELPDIYENIISCVEFLINQNYFNKEYLEEQT